MIEENELLFTNKSFFLLFSKENGIPLEYIRKICLKKGGSMNTYIVSIVCPKFCQNMGKMLEKACLSSLRAQKDRMML